MNQHGITTRALIASQCTVIIINDRDCTTRQSCCIAHARLSLCRVAQSVISRLSVGYQSVTVGYHN